MYYFPGIWILKFLAYWGHSAGSCSSQSLELCENLKKSSYLSPIIAPCNTWQHPMTSPHSFTLTVVFRWWWVVKVHFAEILDIILYWSNVVDLQGHSPNGVAQWLWAQNSEAGRSRFKSCFGSSVTLGKWPVLGGPHFHLLKSGNRALSWWNSCVRRDNPWSFHTWRPALRKN